MSENDMTIDEILEIEHKAFKEAEKKYGNFFANALGFNNLLNNCLKETDPDAHIFVMFLAQVKKYHLLAILSCVRNHHVQGMMNLRQMLEAGANAAYGLANPDHTHFVQDGEHSTLDAPQFLTEKRYKWLNQNYPAGSDAIKRLKKSINVAAHNNMIYVFNNFEMYGSDQHAFGTSYFDKEDEYWIKTDLWSIANIAMGLVDLFYGVNKNAKRVKFADNFQQELKRLEAENLRLKDEMTKHVRYVATQKRMGL